MLSLDKQTEIIAAQCEGVGQRAVSRLTDPTARQLRGWRWRSGDFLRLQSRKGLEPSANGADLRLLPLPRDRDTFVGEALKEARIVRGVSLEVAAIAEGAIDFPPLDPYVMHSTWDVNVADQLRKGNLHRGRGPVREKHRESRIQKWAKQQQGGDRNDQSKDDSTGSLRHSCSHRGRVSWRSL